MSEVEANNSLVAKLAIPAVVLLVVGSLVISALIDRGEDKLINPEILPAFGRIELNAMIYVEREFVNREEYERCKAVVDHYPRNVEESVEEYYKFLIGLGFKLPPLKLKKPASEAQWEKCKAEHDRLLNLQTEIVETQIEEAAKEAEKIMNETPKSENME